MRNRNQDYHLTFIERSRPSSSYRAVILMFDGDKNDFYDYFGGKDYRVLHSVWMLVIVSDMCHRGTSRYRPTYGQIETTQVIFLSTEKEVALFWCDDDIHIIPR